MPEPEAIARVLAADEIMGPRAAAAFCEVSERTVYNYREHAERPEVAEICARLKEAARTEFAQATAVAREKLLAKVLTLCEEADVDKLREVVGAFKTVHDANVSERIIGAGLDIDSLGAASQAGRNEGSKPYGTKH